jgi:PAS domain S-box-containing protein
MTLHEFERIQTRLRSIADPIGFLTNLFAHAPVGLAVWSAEGNALLTNKAFVDIFLVEPPPQYNVLQDELLADNGMLPLFRRAFAGETVHVPTFWYDPREHTAFSITEGRRVAVSMTIFPLFGDDGRLQYVAATYKDETERKRAEDAQSAAEAAAEASGVEQRVAAERLARSEARFRRLSDAGLIGIIATDFQGAVTEANDAFLRMVGYTAEDLRAGNIRWTDMTPPEWQTLDDRVIEQLKLNGVAEPWEKEYFRKDGSRVPILAGVAVLEREAGSCIAFILDLTQQKKAEAALRESEARKAAVMEAALDAIVIMDHEGKITDFNPAAERTFGHLEEDVLGRPLAEVLVPARLRDKHRAGLARYLETGVRSIIGRRIEVPALRKDGSEFPAEVAVVRIRSAGSPVFTGYIRDITERRQASEAEYLRRERDAIKAANRELEAFSYSVAHDLRAPLRAISGFSGALLEEYESALDASARAYLHRIVAAGDRMAKMIDALLSLARLSRAELRREVVNLTEMGRSVMDHLRASEPERSVEFVAEDGLFAHGDPQLLRAVLENLLGNAWKFSQKTPRAHIELGSDGPPGERVSCYVRDNGAGFDMTFAQRLFTPFQRLHSDTEYEGTGVGLATVQRIVERHGGKVWADAEENHGATFHFTVPGILS